MLKLLFYDCFSKNNLTIIVCSHFGIPSFNWYLVLHSNLVLHPSTVKCKAPNKSVKETFKVLWLFICSELHARRNTNKLFSRGQNDKKNFPDNFRKSENFGERFRAAFSQHKMLPEALTCPVQLREL